MSHAYLLRFCPATCHVFLFPQEICILFLATHLLGDRLSLLNWLGFAVCLLGISLHVVLKAMNSKGDCFKSLSLWAFSLLH